VTIELADDQELTSDDDQLNERGVMDFGQWVTMGGKQRFISVCKGCGANKFQALSANDTHCLDCSMPTPYELGELYRLSENF
jgi:hypothetical protein